MDEGDGVTEQSSALAYAEDLWEDLHFQPQQ